MIIEPGRNFELTIDLEDAGFPWKVAGENQKAQIAYMPLPAPYSPSSLMNKFKKDTLSVNLSEVLEREKQEELAPFSDLLASGEISQKVYDAIELERNYLYAQLLKYEIWFDDKDRSANYPMIEALEQKYPPCKEMLRSAFGYWYLENYVWNYKIKMKEGVSEDNITNLFSEKNGLVL